MEQRQINVYTYDELNERAQSNAKEWYYRNVEFFADDYVKALDKFCEILNLTYSVGRYDNIVFTPGRKFDNNVKGLQGLRLQKWLYNNLRNDIFGRKTFWHPNNYKARRKSKIYVTVDCELTGTWVDIVLLEPFYAFVNFSIKFFGTLEAYKNVTFKHLIELAAHKFDADYGKDKAYHYSDERIKEFFEENDTVFFQDGAICNY